MPHLLTLLLQTPAPPPSAAAVAGIFLSAVALAFSFWSFLRKESREDGQTVSQRLKKLTEITAEHGMMHTGQVREREKMAETLGAELREQARAHATELRHLSEECTRRFTALEKDAAEVQRMREVIAAMQTDLKRLQKIEDKLDRLTEILTHKVA